MRRKGEGNAALMDIYSAADGWAGCLLRDGMRECPLFCLAVSGPDCYHKIMPVQPTVLCKQVSDALEDPSNK